MGTGPIPKSAIDAHVQGWPQGEADMFRYVIRQMDGLLLERRAAEAKKPKG